MIPATSSRNAIVALLLAGLVFWAPLPFASVTPGGQLVVRLWIALMLAVAAWTARSTSVLRATWVPMGALLGIAAIGLLQSLPWPRSLVTLLSPRHAALWEEAARMIGDSASPAWSALSLAPAASRAAALSWAAMAALLATAILIGRHRRHRRWIALSLAAAAGFQLLYGFRLLKMGQPVIWGVAIQGPHDRLRGTFVNPNHLALFLEIVLPVVLAALWWASRRRQERLSIERRLALIAPLLAFWLLVFIGLALTGSRAGLLAGIAGVAAQGLLAAAEAGRRRLAVLGLVAVAAALTVVWLVGPERGLGRFLKTSIFEDNLQARFEVSRLAVDLWRRYPVTGTGLGTFEEAFPQVQSPELSSLTWNRAHNDPLELLVTGGLLAILVALAGLGVTVHRLWRILREARRTESRAAALAALGALASVLFHEFFDFGLLLPANSIALAAVVGAACGIRLRHP